MRIRNIKQDGGEIIFDISCCEIKTIITMVGETLTPIFSNLPKTDISPKIMQAVLDTIAAQVANKVDVKG